MARVRARRWRSCGRGNAWLAALGAPDGADVPPIVSLWSWHDSMVAPQTSSRVASARTSRSPASATTRCFATAQVFERVLAEIAKARDQLTPRMRLADAVRVSYQ